MTMVAYQEAAIQVGDLVSSSRSESDAATNAYPPTYMVRLRAPNSILEGTRNPVSSDMRTAYPSEGVGEKNGPDLGNARAR